MYICMYVCLYAYMYTYIYTHTSSSTGSSPPVFRHAAAYFLGPMIDASFARRGSTDLERHRGGRRAVVDCK